MKSTSHDFSKSPLPMISKHPQGDIVFIDGTHHTMGHKRLKLRVVVLQDSEVICQTKPRKPLEHVMYLWNW